MTPVGSRSAARRITRRRFLGGAGALGLGALGLEGFVLEPRRLSVTRHVLGRGTRGGAPGADAIRLVVLADLHLQRIADIHDEIAGAVGDAEPDAILLVGDAVDRADALPVLGEFLDLLPPRGTRVATLGNWEYWGGVDVAALRRTYDRGDTRLLVNEPLALREDAVLFGTDDSLAGSPSLAGLPGPDIATVVLTHCPAYRNRLRDGAHAGVRAVISGHTHGGQLAVGRWAPFLPPESGGYVSGWYRGDGPDLFVSRGLGTSVIPVRLGSVPEVAVIDWHPAPI